MRGKAAAQNANRRAQDAMHEAAGLKARLCEQERIHRLEVASLTEERDQARGRLIREVGRLSKDAIDEAQHAAQRSVREAQQACEDRISNGYSWLCEKLGDQMPADMEGCAAAFGVHPSQLIESLGDPIFNRRARRMSTKKLRDLNAFYAETAESRRPLLEEMSHRRPGGGGPA